MHPRDPVGAATSSAIRWTFALSFTTAVARTAWTVARLRPASR
jgi:hypothetical protein